MSIMRPLLIFIIAPLAIAKVGATELEDRREDAMPVEQPAHSPASAEPVFTAPDPKAPTIAPYQAGGSPGLMPPSPRPAPSLVMEPRRPEPTGPQSSVPRWLEEVRAQRRALHEQRRAAHQARLQAMDPMGTAKRDERTELRLRRQEGVRDLIETERRLYLNRGPWFSPLAPRPPPVPELAPPTRDSLDPRLDPQGAAGIEQQPSSSTSTQAPPDWNNLWYYNGW